MWHRLLERLDDTLLLMALSLVFGIIRTLVQPSARTLRFYLAMFVVSVPVGTIAGQLAMEAGFSDSGCFVATAVSSLLAQDIVTAILKNNHLISRALEQLVDKFTK